MITTAKLDLSAIIGPWIRSKKLLVKLSKEKPQPVKEGAQEVGEDGLDLDLIPVWKEELRR